jgi:hypothetical protein
VRTERTFVGLDVHARSVTGHAVNTVTGEVWQRKLTPDPADIHRWVSGLPGLVRVGYEAGPTGYGLYRYLVEHGVRCSVGAPSKLQRPHGPEASTLLTCGFVRWRAARSLSGRRDSNSRPLDPQDRRSWRPCTSAQG